MMLARKITLEAKRCGGDLQSPSLKAAIAKARSENMPNDNIERAIARGAGSDAALLEEVLYEAYGPGGAALLIEGITDNRNRTNQEMRHLLSKLGFSLAVPGAAAWAFSKTDTGWVPRATLSLSPDDSRTLAELISRIEEHNDVKKVYTNGAHGASTEAAAGARD